MSTATGPKPRATCFQSVDRAVDRSMPRSTRRSTVRSTGLTLCTSCISVDRPSQPVDHAVDRAVDRELTWPASMRRLAPLSSDLCATFRSLLYRLSPYRLDGCHEKKSLATPADSYWVLFHHLLTADGCFLLEGRSHINQIHLDLNTFGALCNKICMEVSIWIYCNTLESNINGW